MVRASIVVGIFAVAITEIFSATAFAHGQDGNTRPVARPVVSSYIPATSQSSDASPDDPPLLIATGDFNRDGITDVAKIVAHEGSL